MSSFFQNLKIGARLMLGFAAVLCLTVLVGVTGIHGISVINAATADEATNWLPATRELGNAGTGLQAERRAEALIVQATTPEVATAESASLEKAKAAVAESWKRYQATIDSAEEQQLATAVEERMKAYLAVQVRALDLAHNADAAGAWALYNGEGRAAFNALNDAVVACTEFQTRGAEKAYAQSQDDYKQTRNLVVGMLVVAVLLGTVLGRLTTTSITRPIHKAVHLAETVAAGDLTSRVTVRRKDECGQLLAALGRMNENLGRIVGQVRQATDSIATGSSQIATGNADLSQRTEEQASNLQQTAASMEQLTVTVKHNADAAHQARQLSQTAQQAAHAGGQVVGQVVSTMADISESSRKIADIIGVIDGIAFQTNILALNAAVEAARAGEQGRGFAVVASEVRSLAQRSAEAAKEIKSLIAASVERVEAGSSLVGNAGTAIEDIMRQVQRVNDLVGEISAASIEQSTGIGQIGDAVAQLDQVTQQNAALVEESAAAAESLRQQAAHMTHTVSTFRLAEGADRA
jgi:methyl-accepting chemotaxis protein